MTIKRTRHAVYNINYHLVWCPKYRKKVLLGNVKEIVEQVIRKTCEEFGWELLELSIQADHVHLFISVPPVWSPMLVVKTIKGRSARKAITEKRFAGRFWSPSYYVGTVGYVSEKTVQQYIQNQKEEA